MAALVQGLRAPEVCEQLVVLRGLDPGQEGLRIVQLSDLHVGPFLRPSWLADRVAQVEALRPDLIVVTGDFVDQDRGMSDEFVPVLGRLHAPLGVWGVTGNHEFYAGMERSLRFLDAAGIRVLHDSAVEIAPHLVLAGVDDLSARRQFGVDDDAIDRALAHRPPGPAILLSHSPLEVHRVSELGVGLMLSGHTHAGQIWPFGYIVRLVYPFLAGRFEVGGTTLLVSRGTGSWGPPMRLFSRGEITLITLAGR